MAEETATTKRQCRWKMLCAVCRLAVIDGKDKAILCEGNVNSDATEAALAFPLNSTKNYRRTTSPFTV